MKRFISILLLISLMLTTACTPLNQLYSYSGAVPVVGGENLERRNVFLLHRNGDVYMGEIYAIRESSLVFSAVARSANNASLQIIEFEDIDGVMKEGTSHVFIGLLIGFIAGMGLLKYQEYKESKESVGEFPTCGGVVGPFDSLFKYMDVFALSIFGGVVGLIYPGSEKKIVPNSEKEIKELRFLARYPYEEPVWIDKVIEGEISLGENNHE